MNITRISKLNNLVTNHLKRKPTVVIEQPQDISLNLFGSNNCINININIDTDEWIVPDDLKIFIEDLAKNTDESNEVKILKIYQKLCEDYTYDDNVLTYIRKNDDDTFFLPDSYGRDTDASWKEKRKQHNRRNCFEISRILAKSITELLKLEGCSKKYDTCILWDEAVTHYFVGLACDDYYLSLDLDDFEQIKDLTRMKTDLTLEGIKILEDPHNKFSPVLEAFNAGRNKIAKDYVEGKMSQANRNQNSEANDNASVDCDDIEFLKYTIQILREEYDLDSAGIFEYAKEIVDTKIGPRSRKKYWKEVENEPGVGTRYTRCLVVTIDDVSYIIDVTKQNPIEIFREINTDELNNPNFKMKSFKEMQRSWEDDPYDGR